MDKYVWLVVWAGSWMGLWRRPSDQSLLMVPFTKISVAACTDTYANTVPIGWLTAWLF